MAVTPKATIGITTNSVAKFMVDAGAIWLNYGETTGERLLGATRGGASFEIEQEIRTIEIDGSKGATMGARRVISVNAKIVAKLMEVTTPNLLLALAGATSTTKGQDGLVGTTHDEISRVSEIALSAYVKNVTLVGRKMGTAENFVGLIKNALADGGFKIETSPNDEVVLEIQFTAHYDPADMVTEPWIIRNPVQVP
jgi:hypothetical protein